MKGKRIFAGLLAAVTCASLLPLAAFAEESVETPTGSDADVNPDEVEWIDFDGETPINGVIEEVSGGGFTIVSSGYYRLAIPEPVVETEVSEISDDAEEEPLEITISGTLVINAEDVTLDLNGYALTPSEGVNCSVITVNENASLTILDRSEDGTGMITGGYATYGGGVYNEGTFTLESGAISGNTATKYGGGVYIDGGTLTMNGGEISNNTATSYGGGVYYQDGTFIMYDGKVSNNATNADGGGVCAYAQKNTTAKFYMCGGTISGNTATYCQSTTVGATSSACGGGVYVRSANEQGTAEFYMYDGTISNNEAGVGGGVYSGVLSKFYMYGGTISDNAAQRTGGGVYNYGSSSSHSTFIMYDGTISGNISNSTKLSSSSTTNYHGGGVYTGNGTFTMYGGMICDNTAYNMVGGGVYNISGTFTIYGGTIVGNQADNGGGVYNNGTSSTQGIFSIVNSDDSEVAIYGNQSDDIYNNSHHAEYVEMTINGTTLSSLTDLNDREWIGVMNQNLPDCEFVEWIVTSDEDNEGSESACASFYSYEITCTDNTDGSIQLDVSNTKSEMNRDGIELPDPSNPEYCTFEWNTAADGSGESYVPGDTLTYKEIPEEGLTLYPVYQLHALTCREECVDETCSDSGHTDCYFCENCGKYFSDTEKFIVIGQSEEEKDGVFIPNSADYSENENYVIPATGHDFTFEDNETYECPDYMEYVAEVTPTCSTSGHEAYFHCTQCDRYFLVDGNETTQDALQTDAVPDNHAELIYVPATEATYESTGNIEYWYCAGCEKYFADEEATAEISYHDTIIAILTTETSETTESVTESSETTESTETTAGVTTETTEISETTEAVTESSETTESTETTAGVTTDTTEVSETTEVVTKSSETTESTETTAGVTEDEDLNGDPVVSETTETTETTAGVTTEDEDLNGDPVVSETTEATEMTAGVTTEDEDLNGAPVVSETTETTETTAGVTTETTEVSETTEAVTESSETTESTETTAGVTTETTEVSETTEAVTESSETAGSESTEPVVSESTETTTEPTDSEEDDSSEDSSEITFPEDFGDLDEDGEISPTDAYYCLVAYASEQLTGDNELSAAQIAAADVNGDGVVDPTDAYYMLCYYATYQLTGTASWEEILAL